MKNFLNKQRTHTTKFLIGVILATVLGTVAVLLGVVYLFVGAQGYSLLIALGLINTQFVGEYDLDDVTDYALAGMVTGLDDRWSYYVDEESYEAQQLTRANQYVGIGVTVSYEREEGLLITDVTEGGPAEESGLQAAEVIIEADGTSLAGDGRADGVSLIQGESGTTVSLVLLSEDGTTRTVEVVRRAIATNPVSYELLEDTIGYVALSNFYDNSDELVEEAVLDLIDQGATSLIFDMRNNGGGYLDELLPMLDFLLPEGAIFSTASRSGTEEITYSDEDCIDLPMAVLVNGNTYSAAEIFAAQLQESVDAIIVGSATSGKGYSQKTFPLLNGGAIGISTSAYCTGSGVSLVGTGLDLDIEVEQTDEGDAQLEAAGAALLDS